MQMYEGKSIHNHIGNFGQVVLSLKNDVTTRPSLETYIRKIRKGT